MCDGYSFCPIKDCDVCEGKKNSADLGERERTDNFLLSEGWQDIKKGKNLPNTDKEVIVYVKYLNKNGGYIDKMHLSECTSEFIFSGYIQLGEKQENYRKVIAWLNIKPPTFA